MKKLFALLLLVLALPAAAAPASNSIPVNAPAVIALTDQFDVPQKLSFPATNLTLLTIADRAGSAQIAGWLPPVKQRFGKQIDIRGLADVSAVPAPLHGLVRKRFQKLQSYPVMMDWSGDAVRALTYEPGKANLLLLDRRGRILKRIAGPAADPLVRDLCAAIELALADRAAPPSTP